MKIHYNLSESELTLLEIHNVSTVHASAYYNGTVSFHNKVFHNKNSITNFS